MKFLYIKLLTYNINVVFIAKTIISSIIMAFVIWKLDPVNMIQILIVIGIAAGIYFGSMLISKGFTKQEYIIFKNFVMVGIKR